MFHDFKELLSRFNAHSVMYLVVGGYAVSFHAQPRATKDLEIFIKADLANAKAVYAALASFGAPLENISLEELSDPRKFIRFGREPVAVDILPRIDESLLMQHGNVAWKALSTRPAGSRRFSFPSRTLLPRNSQRAARAI